MWNIRLRLNKWASGLIKPERRRFFHDEAKRSIPAPIAMRDCVVKNRVSSGKVSAEMTLGQCGVVWTLPSLPDVVGYGFLLGLDEGG